MERSRRRAGAIAIGLVPVLAVVCGLLAAAVVLPVVGLAGVATRDAANTFNDLSVPHLGTVPERSEILNDKGQVIAYYYPNHIDRVPVTYDQIAPVMRDAIVAIEDDSFYKTGALDPRGVARAVVNDASSTAIQGASTLAQQYVKNACILTAYTTAEQNVCYEDTLSRKLRELREAAIVEHELTKQQLLAAYLSVAYFENGSYGIQVAAERYFSTTAGKLDLSQSALLAGMVENPVAYDPLLHPKAAVTRRNTVLARMAQLHYITKAQAQSSEARPLRLNLHNTTLQSGCTATSARGSGFFCSYVFAVLQNQPVFKQAESMLNSVGGLKIYTTLNPSYQRTADAAVDYVAPARGGVYNPGHNVAAEVLIKPGTGAIRAMAIDRPFGEGGVRTEENFTVTSPYGGSVGVQTGSSSKIFTLVTALEQGTPIGWTHSYKSPDNVGPYFNCAGSGESSFVGLNDAEGPQKPGVASIYTGTTQSINVFYAYLEQKDGLCNVVKTAAKMGMTRGDGRSLFKGIGNPKKASYQEPADDLPGFTLGEVNVAPMSMAAAYATLAARGMYCTPTAITKITTISGKALPVASPKCHRVMSTEVADAANYIFQGVLTASGGTAVGRSIGIPAAAKTGTANSGYYAAFAGYTPYLAGYVSVFNPISPTGADAMTYPRADYREVGGALATPSQMFGDNAPGAVWQMTFENLHLPYRSFVTVPYNSPLLSLGSGQSVPQPNTKKAKSPNPSPSPSKGPTPPGKGGGKGK